MAASSEVVVVADVLAADGKADEVTAAFRACLEKTHEEDGCLSYALHVDNANPNHLVNIERWRSQEELDAHMATPYVAALYEVAGQPGMLAQAPTVTMCTSLGLGQAGKGNL